MRKMIHTATVVILAAVSGFGGTSALLAKSVAPNRGMLTNAMPHAGMPIETILIMLDAMAVRAEHARLHGP